MSEFPLLVGHLRLRLVLRKAADAPKCLVDEVEPLIALQNVDLLACCPVGVDHCYHEYGHTKNPDGHVVCHLDGHLDGEILRLLDAQQCRVLGAHHHHLVREVMKPALET